MEKLPYTEIICEWMELSAEQYLALFNQLRRMYLEFNKVHNPSMIEQNRLFQAYYYRHAQRINQEFYERCFHDTDTVLWFLRKEGSRQRISMTNPNEVAEQYIGLHKDKMQATWSVASLLHVLNKINQKR